MVIDNSFAGNDDIWLFPAYATRPVVIAKGTRICQFRIQKKQPKIEFNPVDSLTAENRGSYGSTGV
nr:MAG TPA: dUTPase [Caudoviricetes sp.]